MPGAAWLQIADIHAPQVRYAAKVRPWRHSQTSAGRSLTVNFDPEETSGSIAPWLAFAAYKWLCCSQVEHNHQELWLASVQLAGNLVMKMRNWKIRTAEHRDADALSACIGAAYAQYATSITDLPPVSANCADEIAKYQVWVAEFEEDVVGGLVIIPEENFMRLANVAVHPKLRGIGLGRALITLAETEAVKQGFREMRLNTHVRMPENVQLYTHLGWEQDQRQGNKLSMKKSI